MSNNETKTIKLNENTAAQPKVNKPVEKVQPAVAAADDQKVTTSVPAASESVEEKKPEVKHEETAGASSLAEEVAPETPKKETVAGTDDVLESLRVDNTTRIDAKPEDTDVDLETNQVLLGPRGDELVTMLLKLFPSTDAYKAARRDPNSILSKAIAANDHGWGTTAANDITEVLKNNGADKHLAEQADTSKFQGIKDGRPNRINHKNSDLSGKEAILAIKARLGGLVRVNLLNSGFWIAVRSPQLDELQEVFATIDLESRQIGHILGGHFALITDMYLKKKFCELLVAKRIIVESNFKDIFRAGAFIRNLAYNDYDTILHAVVMLMCRGGLRYRCICPKCGSLSVETLDIGACKFVNEDLWTESVAKWWANTHDVEGKPIRHDEADLVRYRAEILNASETYDQMIENGIVLADGTKDSVKISLLLKEPVMQKYFDVGERLIKQLNATIDSISNGSEDRAELVRASLSVHSYQLIAPWIESLTMYTHDGAVDVKTTDPDAILSHLDESFQKDDALFKTLTKFISKSRFNYIGTQQIKCPKCGLGPNTDMDNFYPLEIQTIFFGLLSRLWLVGR